MFDIGWGELVVIGIVALIAIGPKELPTVLRTLGQYMAKIRRMAADFQGQFQEAMREAEMAELKKQAEDLKSSVSDLTKFDPLAHTQKATDQGAGRVWRDVRNLLCVRQKYLQHSGLAVCLGGWPGKF